MRSGSSCQSRCNYATGKWERAFCAPGLQGSDDHYQCLTVTNKACRLPFNYEGELVRTCTVKNSVNNKAWCATEVNDKSEVVSGQWEEYSSDNHMECTEIAGDCEHFCESPQAGVTKCSYTFDHSYKLGSEIPAKHGDCGDRRWG